MTVTASYVLHRMPPLLAPVLPPPCSVCCTPRSAAGGVRRVTGVDRAAVRSVQSSRHLTGVCIL